MSSSAALDINFLANVSPAYLTELYTQYRQNPAQVPASWANLFDTLGDDVQSLLASQAGALWTPPLPPSIVALQAANTDAPPSTLPAKPAAAAAPAAPAANAGDIKQAVQDASRVAALIRAYRARGHLAAKLDPLGLQVRDNHPELAPEYYGFAAADYGRALKVSNVFGRDEITLTDLVAQLQKLYSGAIGIEFTHLQDPVQKTWVQERIESGSLNATLPTDVRRNIFSEMVRAEGIEQFLQKKYTGTKRFGLEGGETTIPAIEAVLHRGAAAGVQDVVIGMAHRGRLNVLTNVLQKPFVALFSEFQGTPANPDDVLGSGDVKYHLGASADRVLDGHKIHVSLTANPSHLEAVDPVVVGKIRAKQDLRHDQKRAQSMGILLHGDAAIAGQGLVAEVFLLSKLKGYETGGTIHIVTNNQIGFTTTPDYGRSSPYPTDVAKMVQAPILHVNGDDPEAVVRAAYMALDYRMQFGTDVVLDIICYRRYGHNESDEPAFTQPLMYDKIKVQPTTTTLYEQQLNAEGVLSAAETVQIKTDFENLLETAFAAAPSYKPNKADMLDGAWQGMTQAQGADARRGETAVPIKTLQDVGTKLCTVPATFNINSKIARQLDSRRDALKAKGEMDWAAAEHLAFGTLLTEGFAVRFTGQDVQRGTFSHRHAVLTDQKTGEAYVPHKHLSDKQGLMEIYNSPLSEYAVLGYEYGYSLADPNALVLWEAQFGDFVNGAQIMIDQFIASAETKWLRMSGLVMLLPHGSEGQGPEHSSARPERFLQMCAEDNMQVVNCTTPANYFHALRRQMHRNFRKPLIVMSPKSLLRHKMCVSPLAEFSGDWTFRRVIGDDVVASAKTRRVVLCSGKVYYDLLQTRTEQNIKDVALVRVEQLYPFPADAIVRELKKYPKADVVWCQEEPENQGAWQFVDRRLEACMIDAKCSVARPAYAGRVAAAAPATGSLKRHNAEQAALIAQALGK